MTDRRSRLWLWLLVVGAVTLFALGHSATAEGGPADAAPAWVDAMRQRILAQLELRPGMTVAEIGVGRGWFVFRAAEAVGSGGTVYGTDIDPEAIASVQQQLPHLDPAAGHIDLRLCRDERDTALDDLPDDRVDVVLMVDSLCFDARVPHERNVAYLRRFLRILRPGGRLVHHMDCHCDVSFDAVAAQFSDAGFSPRFEFVDLPAAPASADPSAHCRTEATRARQAFVAVFRKPGAATDQEPTHGAAGS